MSPCYSNNNNNIYAWRRWDLSGGKGKGRRRRRRVITSSCQLRTDEGVKSPGAEKGDDEKEPGLISSGKKFWFIIVPSGDRETAWFEVVVTSRREGMYRGSRTENGGAVG